MGWRVGGKEGSEANGGGKGCKWEWGVAVTGVGGTGGKQNVHQLYRCLYRVGVTGARRVGG